MCNLPVWLSFRSQISELGAAAGVIFVQVVPPSVDLCKPVPLVAKYTPPAGSHNTLVHKVKVLVLASKFQVTP